MANVNDKIENDLMDVTDDFLCQLASNMETEHHIKQESVAEEEEEEHLSQKLGQLSTTNKRLPISTSFSSLSTISKKIKTDDHDPKVIKNEEMVKDKIPNYLSLNHQDFQQLMQSLISTTASSFTIQDLQDIAILIYQITIIKLRRLLWNAYLQSGTGKLKPHPLSNITHNDQLFIWPLEVKSMVLNEEKKKNPNQNININQIDHKMCHDYVYRTIYQFSGPQEEYQKKLDEKKHHLNHIFTSDMEDTLIQFIEQQELFFKRLEIQKKIAIVEYDYKDQVIEYEFKQLKPNQYQLQLLENLTRAKQEKEKSKYEVALLKQRRLIQQHLPEPLNSVQLPLPLPPFSLDSIIDEKSRQNLFDRYKKIVEQSKLEMMTLYIAIAEVKMHECQSKFDRDILVEMTPNPHSMTINQRLNQSMINIIQRRFKNMDERFEYLFNLKKRYLDKKR